MSFEGLGGWTRSLLVAPSAGLPKACSCRVGSLATAQTPRAAPPKHAEGLASKPAPGVAASAAQTRPRGPRARARVLI